MKLVLTGGPSAGKTTLARALLKQYAQQVAIVPEAASIMFAGGWPRRTNPDGRKHQQRAIYYLQRELESLIESESPGRLLVCDRGSLDGLAYWPASDDGFLKDLNTNLDYEYGRYDFVLHLDTAPASYYDVSNPLRSESFDEAWALNQKIKAAWSKHPHHIVIDGNAEDFMEKMRRALAVVRLILDGKSHSEIIASLGTP